jgi:VWFA-related protein
MFFKNAILRRLLPFLLTLFVLVGCGGGGGGGDGDGSSGPSYSEMELSFGGVVASQFSDRTVTLMNAGSINLTFEEIEDLSLPFSIENDECSGRTLGPSGTCDIQVRFSPTEQGTHGAFFTVPLSGSDTDFAGVNIEGTSWLYNVSINQVDADACPDIGLVVSITDADNNFVPGLTRDDFILLENGAQADQNTFAVSLGTSSDLSVVLALDTSGSVVDIIEDIISAAKAFIGDMDVEDEAAVFRFAESGAEQVIGFTTATEPDGKNMLVSAIDDEISYIGGGTALYTAVADISEYIASDATAGNRLAIVVVSDGEDTASDMELETVISTAKEAGVPVFTIGLGVSNTEVLQVMADDTGGQYYHSESAENLGDIYLQVSELFSNQYEITYTSDSDGGVLETLGVRVSGLDSSVLGEDSKEVEGCQSP